MLRAPTDRDSHAGLIGATYQKGIDVKPLDQLCINTIRVLSAEAVQKANSGHPGMPMGAAAVAYVLWTRFLKHNPLNPTWADRDRFILSAGHGSMLLYSLLHLTGYDLSLDELRDFRQWGSRTAGHPEYGLTPGVEVTSGPLGQGLAHAVGMAMAERYLATEFNRPGHEIIDHFTYALVGDGDLMEGISQEAISLAGHLKLGKLIYLFDDNRITIEGDTALVTSDDTLARFQACGWDVQAVDGEDVEALTEAIERARQNLGQPSLIAARTHIGYGSPNKQDDCGVHGAPLGEQELRATKEALGLPAEPPFHIAEEVTSHMREAADQGAAREAEWQERFEAYEAAFPAESARWQEWQSGALPEGWETELWAADPGADPIATRSASGKAINALVPALGNLVGGSADLNGSNSVVIKGAGRFAPESFDGPNIYYGIREHVMGAATNGMVLHGGLRAFCATFMVFSDYLRPAIRLAALMETPSVFVFTHDSIGLGEDGPTHQPVEHLPALRAIPGLRVIRPADARETLEAWWAALHQHGPTALILSRQKLAPLPREGADESVPRGARGAYIVTEASGASPRLILIGTGSEVHPCLSASALLEEQGVATRVVSMPSWELFEQQSEAYRESVLPQKHAAILAVEAAIPLGWERYTGRRGAVIGMESFGASAPAGELFERFGFSPAAIVKRAQSILNS